MFFTQAAVDVEVNRKSCKWNSIRVLQLSLVSEKMLRENWPDLEVSQSDTTLHSYSGESIPVVGLILSLLIVEGWS